MADIIFTFWGVNGPEEWMDPVDLQMQAAGDALAVLAMIYNFDRCDLALIAKAAIDDPKRAAARLEEETSIRFHLMPRQWGVIHSELGGTS